MLKACEPTADDVRVPSLLSRRLARTGPRSGPVQSYAANVRDLTLAVPGEFADACAAQARADAPLRSAVARALGLPSQERLHREAARREANVAALLDAISGWRAVHGIPLRCVDGTSELVHLLFGRGGAYAVVASGARSDVRVEGDLYVEGSSKRADVIRSRRRAYRAATALSAACGMPVAVSGLVLIASPHRVEVLRAPHRVDVIREAALDSWLATRDAVWQDDVVSAVATAARRSETWAT